MQSLFKEVRQDSEINVTAVHLFVLYFIFLAVAPIAALLIGVSIVSMNLLGGVIIALFVGVTFSELVLTFSVLFLLSAWYVRKNIAWSVVKRLATRIDPLLAITNLDFYIKKSRVCLALYLFALFIVMPVAVAAYPVLAYCHYDDLLADTTFMLHFGAYGLLYLPMIHWLCIIFLTFLFRGIAGKSNASQS